MSVGIFKMRFYPLYLILHEKFTFSVSANFRLQFAKWAKSRVGPDCFEISILKLPYKPIFMLF